MITDVEAFQVVEKTLRDNGELQEFEKESGEVLGRMMITLGEVPPDLEIEVPEGSCVFIGSFDFYDSVIGIVINPATKQAASGIWITPQVEGAEPPAEDWIEFFVKTLVGSFADDGSYGYPIFSFVNDTADMTIVPTDSSEDE